MRGRLTSAEAERWAAIKSEYVRRNQLGGKDDDPATRVTSQLSLVGRDLGQIREALRAAAAAAQTTAETTAQLQAPERGPARRADPGRARRRPTSTRRPR